MKVRQIDPAPIRGERVEKMMQLPVIPQKLNRKFPELNKILFGSNAFPPPEPVSIVLVQWAKNDGNLYAVDFALVKEIRKMIEVLDIFGVSLSSRQTFFSCVALRPGTFAGERIVQMP